MARTLAHSLRPKKLSQLIGQEELVASLRKQYATGREPSALMFVGPPGTGKTSVARIIALSLQCTHAEFGEPCDDCQKQVSNFWIREVNASEISGKEELGKLAASSVYIPQPPSRRNVFILDEAQRVTKPAQDLMLKYLEDAPTTTVWIICTTEPGKFDPATIRRCRMEELKKLDAEGISKTVKRAFKFVGSDLPQQPIIEKILEAKIQSPGIILNVVEKYFSGKSPKQAVRSTVFGADALAICKALEKGDWNVIKKETSEATSDDLRGIRAQAAGYLRACLERAIPGPRASEYAKAIGRLALVDSFTDATQGPATVAVLYELCQLFAGPEELADADDDVKERD